MMDFSIQAYFEMLEALLGASGCPWIRKQDISSICQYVIEEAYEVLDAHKTKDAVKVEEELGDLLFTVTFLLSLAIREYHLHFKNIVDQGCDKIKRRSPHVFEDPKPITLQELRIQWEAMKAKERKDKKETPLNSIAPSMPTLTRAMKWIELAHKYGYEPQYQDTLGDRLLQLVEEGAHACVNVNHIFEEKLSEFEMDFKKWMEKNKPEIIS